MTPLEELLAEDARALAAAARTAARQALARLAEHGVRAKVIGSLARGDFLPHSDIDLLVLACPPDGGTASRAWSRRRSRVGRSTSSISTRWRRSGEPSSWRRRSMHPIFVDLRQDLAAVAGEAGTLDQEPHA